MSSPVVVQGTAVASPYEHSSTPQQSTAAPVDGAWDGKGAKQANRCRDPIFALLLYVNIGGIAATAGIYGTKAFSDALDDVADASSANYIGYMYVTLICAVFSIVLSGITLPIMMCIPTLLVKVSLLFMLILSGAMVVMSFYYGNQLGGIIGAVFFLIFLCYAKAVWSRIPFASVNLLTATTAIKANLGAIFVAYLFVGIAFGWTILWSIALMGVSADVYIEADGNGGAASVNYGLLFVLFVSFFFTHQVIQNSVHATIAGTVGTWWFTPEDSGCCSAGITGSLIRTFTTSFGSICFGSLIVAVIQALRALANAARDNDNQIFVCIADCILGCLQSIMEYFNKWAFVYVGLYGYSYLEAGKNVITLFKNRGWDAIIADDLISNVFFFLSLVVGLLTGAFGLIFVETNPDWFTGLSTTEAQSTAFALGFISGLVLTSIMMSTIASAVNTVIVCFAEGPAEFESNHPELSRKMRDTWISFYPDCGV